MSAESLKNGMTMECKLIEGCARKAEFKLSKELVDKAFCDALKEVVHHAQLPGFRKGKAPASLLKSRYKDAMADDVRRLVTECAMMKMEEDKSLDVISFGKPSSETPVKEGEEYAFSVDFEVAPEFALPEYKGIGISLPKAGGIEDKLKQRLEYLKGIYAEFKTLDEPAAAGDMLKVSYTSDFPLPEDAPAYLKRSVNAEESWIWLNEPEQIPGAAKALTGAVKDGEYKFTAEFPADWKEEALASRKIAYTVKVFEVQRRVPVDSDEKLAEKLRSKSVEEMLEGIKKSIESEEAMQRKGETKGKAVEALLSMVTDFPLPSAIFNSTVEREFSKIAESAVKSESDVESFKADKDKHLESARKSAVAYLKRFFVLRKISTAEGIKVEQSDIDHQIQGMSSYFGYKEKDVRRMMEQNGGITDLYMEIMMNKTLDMIIENAKVSES